MARGTYCRCNGCRFELDEIDGAVTFTSRCREGGALYKTMMAHHLWTPEGAKAWAAYLEHTREAWPNEWFDSEGHYLASWLVQDDSEVIGSPLETGSPCDPRPIV